MFKLTLYTIQRLETQAVVKALWARLSDPAIAPRFFDLNEDAKIPFSPLSYEQARSLYEQGGFLFITGGQDGFQAMFARQPHGLSTWHLWVETQAVKTGATAHWIQWVFRLCSDLPVLFGMGCDEAEFNAKHSFLRQLPGGRRISGYVGVSAADFSRFLPGIYWLTIFGKELVTNIGHETLSKLTSTIAIPIQPSQMALILKADTQPEDMSERLTLTRSIAETLGTNHFFDKNRSLANLTQYPELSKALEAIGDTSGYPRGGI